MPTAQNDMGAYLFHEGTNYRAYAYMGCHRSKNKRGYTYTFRTWAPNAVAVGILSDCTDWASGEPMHRISDAIWEGKITSDSPLEGVPYKYSITTQAGAILQKGDPYACFSRGADDGASIIWTEASFAWKDKPWLTHRKRTVKTSRQGHYLSVPINIYEAHLPSVARHEDGTYLTYRELADQLAPYLKRMGYTHIELLPLAEYPYDPSWGYQVCAYYAPTSRLGTPEDFKYFINKMHTAGIGVLMDWVPAHFPKDAWGLYEYDGSPLYEYQGWDRQESRSWGTRFFDVGRPEVQSFLISNAMYWIREFHIDGLRVDAVASMLYLDYDRMPGEWIPNVHGTNINLESVAFFKKLNSAILSAYPDVMMIAEESTSFASITHPVSEGGLGFSLKWNMGWANDLFDYVSKDPMYRKYHHKALNFPIMYAFGENYVLPVSHDEVVYGKRSLLNKMFGSPSDKLKQFRTTLLYMMTFPGKKMLFMGTEFGQYSEWDYRKSIEWFMVEHPAHRDALSYVSALNGFYLSQPALWEIDFESDGFSWIYPDCAEQNMIAYRRHDSKGNSLICILSFSGSDLDELRIPAKDGMSYRVLFESEAGHIKESDLALVQSNGGSNLSFRLPAFYGVVLAESEANTTWLDLNES